MGLDVRKPDFVACEPQGADQPAHPCSLMSTFVILFLEIIMTTLAKCKLSLIYLASLCSGVNWFESYLVGNPEDRFSNLEAQL